MSKRLAASALSLALLLSPVKSSTQARSLPQPRPAVEAAQTPAEANAPESLAGLPGGSDDWWSVVQEDIRQSEYSITRQDCTHLPNVAVAYQAPNRAHNLRTCFTAEGARVIPRQVSDATATWEWGLTLTGYGYASTALGTSASAAQPVPGVPTQSVDRNRIEYRYAGLTEWYVNDARGLKHGFTLYRPPAFAAEARPGDRVVLDLALTGSLTPHLTSDGNAIEFTTEGGVTVLHYGGLLVTDASGSQLAAHFELPTHWEGEGPAVRINIDTASARYPITIDPLATSPAWSAESDQTEAYFGCSVATAGDVNGDGYSDVIVGAERYDNGQDNEGRAVVSIAYHTRPRASNADAGGAVFSEVHRHWTLLDVSA